MEWAEVLASGEVAALAYFEVRNCKLH